MTVAPRLTDGGALSSEEHFMEELVQRAFPSEGKSPALMHPSSRGPYLSPSPFGLHRGIRTRQPHRHRGPKLPRWVAPIATAVSAAGGGGSGHPTAHSVFLGARAARGMVPCLRAPPSSLWGNARQWLQATRPPSVWSCGFMWWPFRQVPRHGHEGKSTSCSRVP